MSNFNSTSPEVVSTLLTIASFPGGEAIMKFNNQTYEVTVKLLTPPQKDKRKD